jgi:hypothetical protein
MPEPIIVRDEFTRFVIAARMLPDSTSTTMRAFFDEIFRSNGIPKAICCPKSNPFGSSTSSLLGLTKFSARWLAMGINRQLKGRECFLSTALAGWDIALAPREDSQLDVRFAQSSLGTLDPENVEFTPASN